MRTQGRAPQRRSRLRPAKLKEPGREGGAVDRRSGTAIFVQVETYGRLAQTCSEYLSKGRLVAVQGRLEQEYWLADDRTKRSRHFILAASVEFLDGPPH